MERHFLRVAAGRVAVLCAMGMVVGAGRGATLEGRMRELLGSPLVKGGADQHGCGGGFGSAPDERQRDERTALGTMRRCRWGRRAIASC